VDGYWTDTIPLPNHIQSLIIQTYPKEHYANSTSI
jgi:hypothetical protein